MLLICNRIMIIARFICFDFAFLMLLYLLSFLNHTSLAATINWYDLWPAAVVVALAVA